MGNRIVDIFGERRASGEKALMPFVVGGRPEAGCLGGLLGAAHEGGASIVEVGIPFSDPIADGPVIAGAMHEALESGVTPDSVVEEVRSARARGGLDGLGLVAMVSMSKPSIIARSSRSTSAMSSIEEKPSVASN